MIADPIEPDPLLIRQLAFDLGLGVLEKILERISGFIDGGIIEQVPDASRHDHRNPEWFAFMEGVPDRLDFLIVLLKVHRFTSPSRIVPFHRARLFAFPLCERHKPAGYLPLYPPNLPRDILKPKGAWDRISRHRLRDGEV